MSRGRRWSLAAWVLLVVGIAASVTGALTARDRAQRESRDAFRATAQDVTATLVTVLNRDADLVWTLRGVATMTPRMGTPELRTWYDLVNGTDRQQQGVGVGVVVSLRRSQLAAFLASRRTGSVTPRVVPAGRRPRYCLAAAWIGGPATSRTTSFPTTADLCALRVPVAGGLSIAAALRAQAATGTLTAGADLPVAGDVDSLYMSAPFYRRSASLATSRERSAATRGWVVIAFDRRALLRSALGSHTSLEIRLLRANAGERHARLVAQVGSAPAGSLSHRHVASLDGEWVVLVRGLPPVIGLGGTTLGALVLIVGLVVSVLMFLLIRILSRSRERAFGLVREKTGELRHQALHDALTGLPNRSLVLDRVEQMLARARRDRSRLTALYIDLDGFKHVNDTFGHPAGDELLGIMGARIAAVMRAGDTVGRIAGDEFVVIVDGHTTEAPPELIAQRMLEVLRQPVSLAAARRPMSITASIGIAHGTTSAEQLLSDAQVALAEAKVAGKGGYTAFESRMQTVSQGRLELEMDLREALDRHELFLLYQPTFELRDKRVTGVEALLRWRHPRRGVLAPGEFVPLAESSGLIVPIGRWVLEEACRRGARWDMWGRRLEVAVNVSARQLDDDALVADVRSALVRARLDPGALTLEITETALMLDPVAAARRLHELKELGVRITIDDFGTGYSSLGYLRRFPVDAIKIDQSFVGGIHATREAGPLLHTLVQLGKALGLETLGEGIEDEEQLALLQSEGCDFGQGFLFSRPLAADAVDAFLAAHGSEPEAGPQTPLTVPER